MKARYAPKEWKRFLKLTLNDDWLYDQDLYQEVRQLGILFGGTPLPYNMPKVKKVKCVTEEELPSLINVECPRGFVTQFDTTASAAKHLGCKEHHIDELLRENRAIVSGRLAGYYVYGEYK